jgi:hypothetical protein
MRQETFATFRLPLARILEDRNFNIRIFYGDIDELAVSLMTEGQREPIKVRDEGGDFYVVDGHRRQRAFARALQLRIVPEEGKWLVYDDGQPLREAPGPLHLDYDAQNVICRLLDCGSGAGELFASQLVENAGKPFTFLERSLFLSRLLRQGGASADALALRIGFTPSQIAEARLLFAADPRLLDQVRLGRLSQRLALRLLRAHPAGDQMARLRAAWAAAEVHRRENLLPGDFNWTDDGAVADGDEDEADGPADPVHARFNDLVTRLGDAAHAAPNPAAAERLATLLLIHRYANGQIGYERLEAHLLGRQ